ncbi:MAG: copper amine oxidase N-terminal domain-containing protein [Clostridiales bacterium]|nr:copper amine oxidase N-terminal domain-containing protein [Clostridiales bacterium]
MKKQILALLLACVLCIGCPMSALAAETPETAAPPAPIAAAPDASAASEPDCIAPVPSEAVELPADPEEPEIPDFETWCAQLSEEARAEILKDDPPLWSEYGYDSREAMLADWEMTAEDYDEMLLWAYYWSLYLEDEDEDWDWDDSEWIEETREQMGAPRTGLAVMLNGKFVSFPDAQPEITDGRTMTPLRALADAMGAQTQYDAAARRITVTLGGDTLCFTVGEPELTVTAGDRTRTVSLDCAPYVKDGRTYVPVRFLAEAAGYTVQWDAAFDTAVLIDRDALIASIDRDFTILNRLLPQVAENEQAWKTVTNAAALIDMEGMPSLKLQFGAETTQNSRVGHMKLHADLSDLLESLLPQFGVTLEPDMLATLSQAEAEVIVNQEEGKLYLRCPAVMQFLAAVLPVEANDWIELSIDWTERLSDTSTQQLLELFRSGMTIGKTIYASQLDTGLYGYPVMTYGNTLDMAQSLAAVCGDRCFAQVGSEYVLRFDRDDYERLVYGELPETDDLYDYSRFDLLVRIGERNGAPTLNAEFYISSDGREYASGTLSAAGTQAFCSILFVEADSSRVSVDASAKTEPAETAPLSAPPAGSHIVTQEDLLMPITQP